MSDPVICPEHGAVPASGGVPGWHRTTPDGPLVHVRPLLCNRCGRTCGWESAPEPRTDRRAS